MMSYLLHSSLFLSLFTLFYYFVLRNETFFKLNRWSIMAGITLSLLLPLIQVPASYSIWKKQDSFSEALLAKIDPSQAVRQVPYSSSSTARDAEATVKDDTSAASTGVSTSISAGKILMMIYLVGVGIFTIVFLMQLVILARRRFTLNSFKTGNYTIVEMDKDIEPYSFLHSIFINPTQYDEDTYNHIIEHEKVHIDQSHFIDKIIAEVLVILFWFNPFTWLLRTSIGKNLEFLTDDSLINKGVEKQLYQMSLLKVSVSNQPFNLTMSYNSSFLKNRIKMMNAKKSSIVSSWKYLFILPIFVLSVFSLNAVDVTNHERIVNEDPTASVESAIPIVPVKGKEKTFTLNGKGKLDVSTSGGHIMVKGQTGNQVVVTTNMNVKGKAVEPDSEEWNEALKNFDLKIEKNGSTIVASAKRKDQHSQKSNNVSISFEVNVPTTVSSTLNTSGGHINLVNVEGEQTLNTSGGHIAIDQVTGRVNAKTSGGAITVKDQDGSADLYTSGGHISVDNAAGDIKANTSGGSIALQDIDGPVDANTSGGGITIHGSATKIKAVTSGGNITAHVSGLTQSMHLQTSGGNITTSLDKGKGLDLDIRGSKIDINLENFSGTNKDNRVNGKMNGGGIPITIQNSSGQVRCEFK